MTAFIILAFLSLAGIGAAFLLLKNDREPEEETSRPSPEEAPEPASDEKQKSSILKRLIDLKRKDIEPADTDTDEPVETPSKPEISLSFLTNILKKLNLTDILKKFNIGKKNPESEDIPETTHLPNLNGYLEDEKEKALADEPKTGTASLKTVPADGPVEEKHLPKTEAEEQKDKKELALSSQLSGLQEKYEKLDTLFKEKSAELQKTKESLDNEIKNRKEFNTVKDLLEKEIKDSKDRTRNVQVEYENAKGEIERHEKRAVQLEEKLAQLEKGLSPSTTATPPAKEESKEKKEEAAAPAEKLAAESIQMSSSFDTEPPEPYEEPSQDDEPQEEGSFLKLQPDIISGEPKGSGSIANEIERSLESPPESEIKSDPGRSLTPDTDPKNGEATKIVNPQQKPESPTNNQEENLQNNDNTKE